MRPNWYHFYQVVATKEEMLVLEQQRSIPWDQKMWDRVAEVLRGGESNAAQGSW